VSCPYCDACTAVWDLDCVGWLGQRLHGRYLTAGQTACGAVPSVWHVWFGAEVMWPPREVCWIRMAVLISGSADLTGTWSEKEG